MHRYTKSQLLDFIVPIIILIVLMFIFHQTSLDESLARQFYSPTQPFWPFRDTFLFEIIFHKWGVKLGIAILVGLLGRMLYVWKKPEKRRQRDYLTFVLTSSLLTIIVIFFLKRWSTFPCPWNSVAFGGATIPPSIWKMFSLDLPRGNCFPAGHSSGGFAFLSMYFGYTYIYGKRNLATLLPGLIIGIIFGMTQEIRGAHYISHDFATIIISIFMSWVTSLMYSYYNKRYET